MHDGSSRALNEHTNLLQAGKQWLDGGKAWKVVQFSLPYKCVAFTVFYSTCQIEKAFLEGHRVYLKQCVL